MMITHKKIVSALLSGLMLLSLAGCGSSGEEVESEEPLPEELMEGYSDETRLAAADNVFSLNCDHSSSFNPFATSNASNPVHPGDVRPAL